MRPHFIAHQLTKKHSVLLKAEGAIDNLKQLEVYTVDCDDAAKHCKSPGSYGAVGMSGQCNLTTMHVSVHNDYV